MSHLRMRLVRLWHELLGSLWPIPLVCLLGGIALALTTIAIDRRFDYRLVPVGLTGWPAAAETVLGTFATSLVTLTTPVLSLTLVAVQLAMGQFSPRIVRTLLQDRPSQLAVGLFGAIFVQAILILREVHDETAGGPGMVPGLSVMVAYLLMLASLVGLILYVHRRAVQRPDHHRPGDRPAARVPAPAGDTADSLRPPPRPGRPAPVGGPHHRLGRLCAAGLGRAPPGRRRRPPGDPPAGGGARQQGIGSVPDLSAVDHRTEASQQPPETRRTIT